jgi:hypothetical protein
MSKKPTTASFFYTTLLKNGKYIKEKCSSWRDKPEKLLLSISKIKQGVSNKLKRQRIVEKGKRSKYSSWRDNPGNNKRFSLFRKFGTEVQEELGASSHIIFHVMNIFISSN